MKVYFGTDHAGFTLKESLKTYVASLGHEVIDKGAFSLDPNDDYPDFIKLVAGEVAKDPESRGIILGATGEGESVAADRTPGVRACEFYGGPLDVVRLCREHNDANILSLGARFVSIDEAKHAVELFLKTPFSNEERHIRRIQKI